MKHLRAICVLIFLSLFLLSSESSLAHGGILIDGDCTTDWGSATPADIHSSQVVAGAGGSEWVYLGEEGDARDDTGGTSSNNDIVEVRLTGDSTHLYFCVKMADITNSLIPNINLAVDTDHSSLDTGFTWIGDETCETCPASSYAVLNQADYVERQFNAHSNNDTEFTSELPQNLQFIFDNSENWITADLNTAAANLEQDSIEGKISWIYLGCMSGPCENLKINLTTYRNSPQYNDNQDTTFDLTGGDGIDLMGGTPGLSQNASTRDFSDGTLTSFYTVSFDKPTAVSLQSASATVQPRIVSILAFILLAILVSLASRAVIKQPGKGHEH